MNKEMKQLYRVEAVVYVMAESDFKACQTAENEFTYEDCDAEVAESVHHSWFDALPFGSDDDLTCGEIIKEQAKRIKAERLQMTLELEAKHES